MDPEIDRSEPLIPSEDESGLFGAQHFRRLCGAASSQNQQFDQHVDLPGNFHNGEFPKGAVASSCG
jgi:hypothetical protein